MLKYFKKKYFCGNRVCSMNNFYFIAKNIKFMSVKVASFIVIYNLLQVPEYSEKIAA